MLYPVTLQVFQELTGRGVAGYFFNLGKCVRGYSAVFPVDFRDKCTAVSKIPCKYFNFYLRVEILRGI